MSAIIRQTGKQKNPSGTWVPGEGERFHSLLSRLDSQRAVKTRDEAIRAVAKCVQPQLGVKKSVSQLVLGQVQSGKTSNMVHTIGLAVDNGIPLVIVLTGTKRILDSQTVRDLKGNLQGQSSGSTPWFNFREVGPGHDDFKSSANAEPILHMANDWYLAAGHHSIDSNAGSPLCIFLLKNTTNMGTFIETMKSVDPNLLTMPALIIDDEADQAGPDSGKPDAPSKTNQRIHELRSLFPQHSYLLYTATPQAPLLSHLGNALSPEWVTNLQPGPDYVGISDLFPKQVAGSEYQSHFRKEIDAGDVSKFREEGVTDVPQSLHSALAYFFVYGAIARTSVYGLKFATMMIHTSANNAPMEDTDKWVKQIVGQWRILFDRQSDPDFEIEWKHLFQPAWEELQLDMQRAQKGVPLSLEELRQAIKVLLNRNNIKILNQKTANLLDDQWNGTLAWILIGGEKLSRGFRVENLITTYMPREKSVSDSALDTVQQRGRFFGYRRKYLELLKAWLPNGILSAFDTYREHDSQLRAVLMEIEKNGLPLRAWKRILLTNPGFVPTRKNVVKLGVDRFSLRPGSTAFSQRYLFSEGLAEATYGTYINLLERCKRNGLMKADEFGGGKQLQRAFASRITYNELRDYLLEIYEELAGLDSYSLSRTIDQLTQLDDSDSKAPGCLVIFHESRELDGEIFTATPDKRGPAGGTSSEFDVLAVGSETPVSGLSRSNASDQVPRFYDELEFKEFVLHLYIFDLYRVAVKDDLDSKYLFARNVPALQLQVPKLPLMAVVQQSAKYE
jgi:hypothetical protein